MICLGVGRRLKQLKTTFNMKYITLVLIILLASCDVINKERTIVKEDIGTSEPHITYYHDCRTGLCFAEIITFDNRHSHTYVPCDSVKQFLAACD
jgi:hypothetical protein